MLHLGRKAACTHSAPRNFWLGSLCLQGPALLAKHTDCVILSTFRYSTSSVAPRAEDFSTTFVSVSLNTRRSGGQVVTPKKTYSLKLLGKRTNIQTGFQRSQLVELLHKDVVTR
jgi:hypothetical protein